MADYTRPHERATPQREPATPQEVWAILRELAESRKETDRRMQETDRRLRKLDELFSGQWGKLMEALVEGDLSTLLNRRGIRVDHTVSNPRKEHGARRWETDILAVNGDEVVVVEVKTNPQGKPRGPLARIVAGIHGVDARVWQQANPWRGGVPEGR